jgi:hypothetical protein
VIVVEIVAGTKLDSGGSVALGTAQVSIGHSVASTDGVVVVVAGASLRISGSSESQESAGLVFSEGINGLGGRSGGGSVGAKTPSIVSLGDTSKLHEALVLVGLSINAAGGTVDDWAAGLGGEVVRLGGESRHVDQCTDAVVGDWHTFEVAIDEHGGRGSDQDA